MTRLWKNGTLITPDGPVTADIRFSDTILEIGEDLPAQDSEVTDITGLTVLPGLIDCHVHLRDPGYTEKETIATGTLAAAHGGFTTIFAMPNLKPFPSTPDMMQDYLSRLQTEGIISVIPYGTITVDEAGREPTDYASLPTRFFSDDGVGVADETIMKACLQENARLGTLFACHTEDMKWRKPGASVHDGDYTGNWIGIPSACETDQLARDLELLKTTGGRYHACHISAKTSVQALEAAKQAGLDVSAEVTAHHLLLEDKDVKGPDWKMNPPLRSHEDRMALIAALEAGTLDFIASDHAPHTAVEKARPMDKAPFGIVSLETSFPLLYTHFVSAGRWTLPQLVNWMSTAPAKRMGLADRGSLVPGLRADLVLLDEHQTGTIQKAAFLSKGKNTPFEGWPIACAIRETVHQGNTVWKGN